jgi:hypothetical protein
MTRCIRFIIYRHCVARSTINLYEFISSSKVAENLKSIHKVLEKASAEKLTGRDEWDSDDEDVLQSIADHAASLKNADRPGSDDSMEVDDVAGGMGIGANAEGAAPAVTTTAGVNNNIDSHVATDVEMGGAGDGGENPVGVEGSSGADGLGEKKDEVSAESTGSEEAIKDVPRP